MKLISWNVNGLRACLKKGFLESVQSLDADVLCLQETKMQPGQCEIDLPGYEQIYNSAEKKGYSGTAVFSRVPILSRTFGIGQSEHDREGRVICCEYADFFLVCCYTPNSQDGLRRLEYRMRWEDAFREYLLDLNQKKPVIVCGDLNVAHQEIDLKNPKTNRKNAGFTDQEREKLSTLLASGFVDTFRFFTGRNRGIQLVELHRQRSLPQRGLAHRLFPGLGKAPGSPCLGFDPSGNLWKRPLSCGIEPANGGFGSNFRGFGASVLALTSYSGYNKRVLEVDE